MSILSNGIFNFFARKSNPEENLWEIKVNAPSQFNESPSMSSSFAIIENYCLGNVTIN